MRRRYLEKITTCFCVGVQPQESVKTSNAVQAGSSFRGSALIKDWIEMRLVHRDIDKTGIG